MKINKKNLLLAATTATLASPFFAFLPAQALTWTVNNGTVATSPPTPITGNFSIDNENSDSPTVTFADLTIDGLAFTTADVFNISLSMPSGSGIEAIDWDNGSNSLSLVFEFPLTTAGGTILLNEIVSDLDGNAVSGSVTSIPEPRTILGLTAAIGFGVLFKGKLKRASKK